MRRKRKKRQGWRGGRGEGGGSYCQVVYEEEGVGKEGIGFIRPHPGPGI